MSIQVMSTTDSKEAVQALNSALANKESDETKNTASSESEESDTQDETIEASDTSSKTDEDEADSSVSEDDDGLKDESKEDQKPKKKGGFQKKIDKLSAKAARAREEAEYWRNEALKAKPQEKPEVNTKPKTETQSLSTKPKEESFDTHAEYVEALTDWKIEQRDKDREMKAKEVEVKTQYEKAVKSFQQKVSEFQKSHDDFKEALEDVDDIPLSFGLQEVIVSSDFGPQVMYELAKNREELERVNRLSPLAAAREIGKIEARLAKESDSSEKNQNINKQTKAPPPINPVSGKGSARPIKSIFDPNISQTQYEELRMQQIAKNRR